MPKLWEKTGDAKDNSDLFEVDTSKLTISKPTVVFISGRDQVDGSPTSLSKNLYLVNKLLSDLPNPPKVYLWSHSNMYSKIAVIKDLTSLFHVTAYNHFQRLRLPAANKLAKEVIMPLVTDTEGKPLPFEQAQKNLRNLTLLGYCLGSIIAQEARNASMKMMKKAGYSEEDRQKLRDEVVLISIGTVSRPEHEKDSFMTINFVNSDDLFVGIKNLVTHPLISFIKLGKIFSTAARKLNIKQLSKTNVVVSAAAREKPLATLLREHPREVIEDVTLPHWKPATNHEPGDYINDEETKSQLAGMVKIALYNAVTRKGTISNALELLKEPSLPAEETKQEQDLYNRKIVGGLCRGGRQPKWKKFFRV